MSKNLDYYSGSSSEDDGSNRREAQAGAIVSGGRTTHVPSIGLPKGGGAIRGMGEKFAANPVTGTGSMSVPIATSPGRSGFGPQLALTYDSSAGNGPFGLGWSLSLPTITRKTDKGLPRYDDAQESDLFILSGTEDLVPVLVKQGEEWVPENVPDLTLGNVTYAIKRYRPRIEGLFARIERWSNKNNPEDVFWRSISKDNVTTSYGKTKKSRIADPSDGSKIFSWLICESYDDKGNAIRYEYKEENADPIDLFANEKNRIRTSQRYLKRIKYGNKTPRVPNEDLAKRRDWMFEVVFDYGEHYTEDDQGQPTTVYIKDSQRKWPMRPDPFSSYRAGFEVRTYRLCHRVLMFHHFAELEIPNYLVRATHFTISQDPSFSFITAATQSGYLWQTGTSRYLKKSLPPVEFEYSEARIDETIREVEAESLENLPHGLDGSNYQWVDLDGEGLSGILTEQGGAWFYKRNLSALPVSEINDKPQYSVRFAAVECLSTMPNLSGGQQLLDLAGNGQLDVVEFDGPVPGFFERMLDETWETFTPFASLPNVAWKDPNLRFVDLTGDGHADILITEDEVFTWYPSLAEEGFGPAEKVRQTFDEETGPRLVFADGTQSIYLSDFSGDGLTDLVRIRNGEVCYWPNLGYGRFGAKVTMDHAPWFDAPDQFDQKRIRLADINGSGVVDIIYLAADGVRLYFNESGNRWSEARLLSNFPAIDNLSSVQVADLLGNGTACLVWSSPLPGVARRPMRYINLIGGQKPHLLIKTVNNLGAETQMHYAPSTKFYLADKYAGRPWITKLPFPVHCIERVVVTDKWRQTKFSTTYSYHHGYFDGVEREFRGFGRVEQVDVESFGVFSAGNVDSPYITNDRKLYQPPVKTITWFHTGAALDRQRILTQVQREYFPNSLAALPGYSALLTGFNEKPLPEPDLQSQDLNADEWREALRACKGMTLRQEIYELDVDQLEAGKQIPVRLFRAATHNCHIRRLQPKGRNQHAVFLVTEREALSYHYELDLRSVTFPADPDAIEPLEPDPRVAHTLNLSFDEYGNIQQSIAVGYKRFHSFADSGLTEHLGLIHEVQSEQHIAYTETHYTGDAIEPKTGTAVIQNYRLPVPCEVQTYELTGFTLSPGPSYFNLSQFRDYHLSDTLPNQGSKTVGKLEYHERPSLSPNVIEKRKVEHARTLFFVDDDPTDTLKFLKKPLSLGTLGKFGLPYEQYKLALTDQLISAVFTNAQLNAVVPSDAATPKTVHDILNHWQTSGYLSGTDATDKFGPGAAGQYWMRSGIAGFAPDAAQHFYLPERYTDPFNNVTTLAYDGKYDLFIQLSTDALGNHTGIFVDPDPKVGIRFDYRVLAPAEMEDINGNRTEAWFDVLGMVVAVAVKGKVNTAGVTEADSLYGYTNAFANPTLAAVLNYFDLPSLTADQARNRFSPILGNATTRFLYHFGEKIENGKTIWASRPAGACAIVREQHVASLSIGDPPGPLQIAFECSDGMGIVLMKRSQAEPETVNGNLRWIVSGKNVLNNKGKPVKQYEPYFSVSSACCAEGDQHEEVGVTPLMYYDAVGRLVRTELPDGTVSRIEFSPWHVKSFDANDTVGRFVRIDLPDGTFRFEFSPWRVGTHDTIKESRWYSDRNPPPPEQALPRDPITRELTVSADQRAAWLAARHADTPALAIVDSLGREVIAITHNRVEDTSGPYLFGGQHYRDERYVTFTRLDAEGKPLWIRDARGNLVMQYITPAKPNNDPSDAMPGNAIPCYDIAGNLLFQHSMDAGDRWMLTDAAGKPMFGWDFNERQEANSTFTGEQRLYVTEYDELHRPIAQGLSINDGPRQMIERFEYRDTKNAAGTLNPQLAADEAANVIGQLVRHYDPSGLTETVRRDFKGNVLEVERRLNNQPMASLIDWQGEPPALLAKLAADTFRQLTEYDALNRMTLHYNWHRDPGTVAAFEPKYNRRGVLQSEKLRVRASRTPAGPVGGVNATRPDEIQEIHYNAKGQKIFLKLGNGAITQCDYDPRTFRLRQLRTTRLTTGEVDPEFPDFASQLSDARVVQQLHYTYDPVGNVTEIYDEAYEPVFFQNQQVEPHSRFEYDSLYRLISATGRENGALTGAPTNVEDSPIAAQFPIQSADPNALRNYTQTYRYDAVGNIERVHHEAGIGTWTRDYDYAFNDSTQPASNRLWQTWTGGDRDEGTTYAHDTHGNVLNLVNTDPRFNMRWDHRDMIRSIDLGGGGWAYYQYDASKQRTRKRIERNGSGSEERIYLGGYELYRRTVAGVVVEEIESHHLFEGEQRVLLVDDVLKTDRKHANLAAYKTEPIFRYQYSNHLGSACLELDHQAEIISYEEYHPYGTSAYRTMRSGIEAPPNRYRYTGMERDDETGLSYHGARYLSPWLAAWLSCDPKCPAADINCYSYARGNPAKFLDRNGKQAMPATPEEIEIFRKGMEDFSRSLLVSKPIYIPPENHAAVMRMLPDGSFIIAESSHAEREYREISRQMAVARAQKTFENISSGPGGAIGYLVGGDIGSDRGAFWDAMLMSVAPHPLNSQQVVNEAERGELKPPTEKNWNPTFIRNQTKQLNKLPTSDPVRKALLDPVTNKLRGTQRRDPNKIGLEAGHLDAKSSLRQQRLALQDADLNARAGETIESKDSREKESKDKRFSVHVAVEIRPGVHMEVGTLKQYVRLGVLPPEVLENAVPSQGWLAPEPVASAPGLVAQTPTATGNRPGTTHIEMDPELNLNIDIVHPVRR